MAGAMGSTEAIAGLDGVPPGIRHFGSSQGCRGEGLAAIHARAAGSNRSAVATVA